jgi:hypothetical protein
VTGLEKTGDEDAQALALELVEKWVRNTYVSYEQSDKKMFEKYDVEQVTIYFRYTFKVLLIKQNLNNDISVWLSRRRW